ncbi:hypothetical protein PFDG_04803 [Plasmodium falciparum Dd2]|uniref:Uncharacterized protein n=1 Tax=Plasmodium falciparum (isolate Dd2) TaxID=57267 RepID=A0A0L7M8W5_PLAF4|nr:hypothetical protein PFDG_04803 [Plasmodium falciparum Dd2]
MKKIFLLRFTYHILIREKKTKIHKAILFYMFVVVQTLNQKRINLLLKDLN